MVWACVLACIATFFAGYYYRDLKKRVERLEQVVKAKVDKPVVPEEPKSTLIDPDDPVQTAVYEHEQMMKKLNPDE